jgi:hypothetical protein
MRMSLIGRACALPTGIGIMAASFAGFSMRMRKNPRSPGSAGPAVVQTARAAKNDRELPVPSFQQKQPGFGWELETEL